jgi:hypothetical protein
LPLIDYMLLNCVESSIMRIDCEDITKG